MNNFPKVPRTIGGKVVMVTLCPPRAAQNALPFSVAPIAENIGSISWRYDPAHDPRNDEKR